MRSQDSRRHIRILHTVWEVSIFGVILVRMQENTGQNNSEYRHFLHSELIASFQLLIIAGKLSIWHIWGNFEYVCKYQNSMLKLRIVDWKEIRAKRA